MPGKKKTRGLTPGRKAVLDAMVHVEDGNYGIPATIREVMDLTGIASTNGVKDHILTLIREGYVVKANGGSRCYKVVKRG